MPRGGKRKGAGRPKGTGKFGVPTKAIRVPEKMVDQIISYVYAKGYKFPLYESTPKKDKSGEQYLPGEFDMNKGMNKTTFAFLLPDNTMSGAGLYAGSTALVDKSAEVKEGDIVVALWKDELVARRLVKYGETVELKSEGARTPAIKAAVADLPIWGVVKAVYKAL